ncbi:MAG: hypothetical protein NUV72_07190 [Bauldia sp.]|nr:hypothetical protein [Bauldia sp.]
MNWHVVRTKPQSEAKALTKLVAQDYKVFLPLCREAANAPMKPLFPRYMFLESDGRQPLSPVDYTAGVSGVLRRSDGVPHVVPDIVISDIRARMVVGRGAVDVAPAAPKEGEKITIEIGPFEGLVGLYLGGDEHRVTLLLDILGLATKIRVPRSSLGSA